MKYIVTLLTVLSPLLASADWGVDMQVDHVRCIGELSKSDAPTNMKYVEIAIDNTTKTNQKGLMTFREEVTGFSVMTKVLNPPLKTNVGSEGTVYTQYEIASGQGFRLNMGDNQAGEMAAAALDNDTDKVMKVRGSIDMWKWEGQKVRRWYTLSCHLKLSHPKTNGRPILNN